ncbi:aminofutalosine synthase MqnE [Poriferisphaera sp. WC338]|uniref:aminofutalosine synthase MqnE n=1 Tax=Poriferisphaera sp. WC338 TaxID=3425129 RepID=UPI003D8190D5
MHENTINQITDPALMSIAEKVFAGARLSPEDGLTLLQSADIYTIGRLANHVRQNLHGHTTYYNINRHLNYSNICALSCKFCAFHRKRDQDGAYEYDMDRIRKEAITALDAGATEMHIVGGLHPFLPFDYYTEMLSAIRETAPNIHIKAFTAVEIVHLARISKRPNDIEAVLQDLKEAGLGSLPGGGAEVFDDRVHDEAFKGKIRSDKWLDVHRIAHKLGLMTNATMLYGHIESLEDRVHHFTMLRDAQDEAINNNHAGRFQTIIPLPFIPDNSELQHLPGPSGLDNLKMLAISRLMLDNFPHVKAFWIMQTLPLAQIALDYGVDDMDGTVVWYDITKTEGQGTHQEVTPTTLKTAIIEAGYTPVERDTLYYPITRDGKDWQRAEESMLLS